MCLRSIPFPSWQLSSEDVHKMWVTASSGLCPTLSVYAFKTRLPPLSPLVTIKIAKGLLLHKHWLRLAKKKKERKRKEKTKESLSKRNNYFKTEKADSKALT